MTSLSDVPAELLDELTAAGLDHDDVWDTIRRALEEDLPDRSGTTRRAGPRSPRGRWARRCSRPASRASSPASASRPSSSTWSARRVTDRLPDGTRVEKGDVVMRVSGRTRQLLVAERTALNLACHLSGIATATARWVEALEGSPTRVLDTRKTLPGLRALQKYAVRCGGGVNHRTSLQDMAMVKDNHVIAAGGVLPALDAIRGQFPGLPVEVEVTTLEQLDDLLALPQPPERILLDNMTDELMTDAVRRTAGRVPLEASGGITLERAARIGATGVDFVSVGALTHSVTVFDIGMDLVGDMSLLAADIGNSHTFLGLLDGQDVTAHWRVATDERRTADEWSVLIRGLLADRADDVVGIAVCATVPAVLHEWREMLAPHFSGVPAIVVEPGIRTGIPVLMDNPREVGADRIVNSLAAVTLHGGPAIVVDFGTATTFDVVNAAGQYVGGAISPGIEISLEALGRRGAQLRKVELAPPPVGDRQEHRRGAPERHGLRRRGPGRGSGRADDRRAGRAGRRRHRHRHRTSRSAADG